VTYEELGDGYVQTSLGRIHFRKNKGFGSKMIFLHGFGASGKSFHKLCDLLPSSIEAYFVDLLGHGDSDAPAISYTIDKQVRVMKEFMVSIGAQESYLFGNSYGGWIAALIAQEKGYAGKGIILEDSVGLKEYFEDVFGKMTPQEIKDQVKKEVRFLNPREQVVESILGADTPESLYLTRESLSRISKPSLLLWGAEDKIVDVKYAKIFNSYIKGSRLEIIREAGHAPHYTNPDKVRDLLVSFIRN
jgi:pimeloyl-ACP methyl ester carboxylesterase